MPKVKNKLLYYAHRKYGKDIIVRKEESGMLRFWTEFYAITLTLSSDGKIEEKIRKREGANVKQYFDELESKPKADKPVKSTVKKATVKKTIAKNTVTKASPKKKPEKSTMNAKPIKKAPIRKPKCEKKSEKVAVSKTTKKSAKVAHPKFRPGDFVKSLYCDDLFTIISNDGDGMVRVAAGRVAPNDTKFHSEYIMAQSDLARGDST
jgi:hypothetical protein